jgi:hypothetical protein
MGKAMVGVEGLHEAEPNAAGAAERSPIWLLIMILLNTVPGLEKITALNALATSEECQSERNRIGFEMAAAYPYERDFVIACRLNLKHSSYERLKKGRVNVVEAKNEDEDLPTCDLMRSSKRHNQLLKGRSNHAIPLSDESFSKKLPTPFIFFYRPSYFSEIGLSARLRRTS